MKALFLPFEKINFLLCILGFFGLVLLPAQTAAEIEILLETPAVTYAQAARFVLKASETAQISNLEEAFSFAAERNWLPRDVSPDSAARLDVVSMLFMKSFGIKGGLLYSIFKNPHYAYRELVNMSAIQGKAYPTRAVSGEQLLFIASRVLSITENE